MAKSVAKSASNTHIFPTSKEMLIKSHSTLLPNHTRKSPAHTEQGLIIIISFTQAGAHSHAVSHTHHIR